MDFVYGLIPSLYSLTRALPLTRYLQTPFPFFFDADLQDNGYSYLPQWQPSNNPAMQSNLTVKNDGRARYCQKCNYMKPDRTHHCSICKRCILKMDHHCPWLGNCIGFRNYKPFVLFLVYLSLFCLVCCVESAVTLWYWISYVTPVRTPTPPAFREGCWLTLCRTRIIFPYSGFYSPSSQ